MVMVWFNGKKVDARENRAEIAAYLVGELEVWLKLRNAIYSMPNTNTEFNAAYRKLDSFSDSEWTTKAKAIEFVSFKIDDLLTSDLAKAIESLGN